MNRKTGEIEFLTLYFQIMPPVCLKHQTQHFKKIAVLGHGSIQETQDSARSVRHLSQIQVLESENRTKIAAENIS